MEFRMRAVEFLDKNEVQLAPCYLLQGTDGYIVRSVVDKILSALPEEDREFNYDEFGEEAPVADVIAALETVSLTGSCVAGTGLSLPKRRELSGVICRRPISTAFSSSKTRRADIPNTTTRFSG